LSDQVLVIICLEQGADSLHMVQLMPLHPEALSSLALFESRLVLPFWYQLTQVVLEKRPLNWCNSSSSSSSSFNEITTQHMLSTSHHMVTPDEGYLAQTTSIN